MTKKITLLEGLIKSHPAALYAFNLQKRIMLKGITEWSLNPDGNSILASGYFDDYSQLMSLISEIDQLNNLFGYFTAAYLLHKPNGYVIYDNKKDLFKLKREEGLNLTIQIEPKFDKPEKIKEKYFHITLKKNVNSILQKGLIPKGKSKKAYHPDRIYLFVDERSAVNKAKLLYWETKGKDTVLLEITTTGLNLIMYKDPQMSNGVYTLDNIPPSNIKLIKEL